MKGQANIEYVAALLIFVTIAIYIFFQISHIIPNYHFKSMRNRLYEDCFRLSEIMVKDSKSVHGFAIKPYELNYTKIQNFYSACSASYDSLKDSMKIKPERDFLIKIKIDGNPTTFECGKRIPSYTVAASIERYATTDGNITKIEFHVW